MGRVSGIGVLDKAVSVLDAVEAAPASLAGWSRPPGCPGPPPTAWPSPSRPTGSCARDGAGRFVLGPRLTGLDLPARARPALEALRDATGESVQLYVRAGRPPAVRALAGVAPRPAHDRARGHVACPSTWARPARSWRADAAAGAGPRASRSGSGAWRR